MTRRLLLTGFEPFGGSTLNPSQCVVERLHTSRHDGVEIIPLILPVVGMAAPRRLLAAIRRSDPAAVLMLGESAAATAITLERVALNLRDYRIPDNAGRQVRERPVVRAAPAAYFSTLPLLGIRARLHAAKVPCVLSLSAGSFLCNEVMFAALHALRARSVPCGFLHLPRLPEQVLGERTAPCMALELMERGVRLTVAEIAGRRSRGGRRAGSLRA
jgi:pyroglutamyl-peptidase